MSTKGSTSGLDTLSEHRSSVVRQDGFTLIELMIAMVTASILLALVFSVYTRLSVSYRAQSDVSDVQQSLRAVVKHMSDPLRAAGHMIPDGFAVNGVGTVSALVVTNDTDPADSMFSPDEVRAYYADASASAVVLAAPAPTTNMLSVNDRDLFEVDDLVLITNPRAPAVVAVGQAPVVGYDACLVQITSISGTAPAVLEFASAPPFNASPNAHCATALDMTRPIPPRIYLFGARGYRIDPSPGKRRTGALQMSPSGGLKPDDWQLMGVGFTNLQLALRYVDGDAVDADGDGDPARDWYSGSVSAPAGAVPTHVNVGVEVRSFKELDVIPSNRTPAFMVDSADPDHNRLGDWDSQPLFGVSDGGRPEQYQGEHIYRSSTSLVDLRNLGVGR